MQLLAAAQTHTEAVLRAELKAARETNAVDLPRRLRRRVDRRRARRQPAEHGRGTRRRRLRRRRRSVPLPALMLAACAGLLGIGAAFASRRGVGFATAALPILALLLAGI